MKISKQTLGWLLRLYEPFNVQLTRLEKQWGVTWYHISRQAIKCKISANKSLFRMLLIE